MNGEKIKNSQIHVERIDDFFDKYLYRMRGKIGNPPLSSTFSGKGPPSFIIKNKANTASKYIECDLK
jgi:hypothetical protein